MYIKGEILKQQQQSNSNFIQMQNSLNTESFKHTSQLQLKHIAAFNFWNVLAQLIHDPHTNTIQCLGQGVKCIMLRLMEFCLTDCPKFGGQVNNKGASYCNTLFGKPIDYGEATRRLILQNLENLVSTQIYANIPNDISQHESMFDPSPCPMM